MDTSPQALPDQERIDRIKNRLAAIAADQNSGLFSLEITPLTEAELQSLPQNLPKSHYEFLKQIGAITVSYWGEVPIGILAPVLWENYDVANGIPPEPGSFLCAAFGHDAEIYGYRTKKTPFELIASHCVNFAPCRCEEDSFLDVAEKLLDIPTQFKK